MLKNIFLLLFLLLLSLGCEQKHFSHIYDKQEIGAKIDSITLINKNGDFKELFKNKLRSKGFKLKQNSIYKLQTEYRLYPKKCNNPLATAEQKSYIGFVQLILFKEQKRVYMVQSDFKSINEADSTIKNLIDIMIDEMKLSR